MKISKGNQNSAKISRQTRVADDGMLRRGWGMRRTFDATMAAGACCRRSGRGRSGCTTPLLKWKFHESFVGGGALVTGGRGVRRVIGDDDMVMVSARKLTAALWRLAPPDTNAAHGGGGVRWQFNYLDWLGVELNSSLQIPNSEMEGATKWDTSYSKGFSEVQHLCSPLKELKPNENQRIATISVASSLKVQLVHAREHIKKLETNHRLSKKKLKNFLKKLNEVKASWKRVERNKVRAAVDELKRERQNCRYIHIVNSKLLNDLTDAMLSAKLLKQKCEKERKTQVFLEDVCDRLAKDIEGNKSEIEVLRGQRLRIREEMEEERKMLQMAEVLRAERVQMKLVDAKLILENKLCEINTLVRDLENIIRSRNVSLDVEPMIDKEMKEPSCTPLKSLNSQTNEISCPRGDDLCTKTSVHENHSLSNMSTSSNTTTSLRRVSLQRDDLKVQWCSSGTRNPHIARAMKGCIEFPRGIQRSGLKSKLLEARLAGQRTQLQSILKQRN